MRSTLHITSLVVVASMLMACTAEKMTEIVVSVATDLHVTNELKAIGLKVKRYRDKEYKLEHQWDLASTPGGDFITLPATFGLLPAGNISDPLEILVQGFNTSKTNPDVSRLARLPFVKDRVLWLRMNLLRRCLYINCPDGLTCDDNGKCSKPDVNPDDLPGFTGVVNLNLPDSLVQEQNKPHDAGADQPDGQPIIDGPVKLDGPEMDHSITPDKLVPTPDAPPDAPKPDQSLDTTPPPPDQSPDTTPPLPDQSLDTTPPPPDQSPDTTPPTPDLTPASDTIPTLGCLNKWCTLGPGTFSMGSPSGENCQGTDERQHTVTLTYYFEIGQYEVTRADWHAVFGNNTDPSTDTTCGDDCPVESLTWHMAVDYCNRLSGPKGLSECYTCSGSGTGTSCVVKSAYTTSNKLLTCKGYRLPSEAEWEYAARAGSTKALYNNANLPASACASGSAGVANSISWYKANSGGVKHTVGTRTANAWSLHDMAGNVSEWVADGFLGNYAPGSVKDPCYLTQSNGNCLLGAEHMAVYRGGRYNYNVDLVRSANRSASCRHLFGSSGNRGVRCARSLTSPIP